MSSSVIDSDYSNISYYLDKYIRDRNISDMSKESQAKWNAALIYINTYYIMPNYIELLKVEGNKDNKYDLVKLNKICDIYIALCYEYDKEISLYGFMLLTKVSKDTILNWGKREESSNGTQGLSSLGIDLYKKLSIGREESLSNKLSSGKVNPVGPLAILNRHYGWNNGGQQEKRIKLELPSKEEIAAKYGIEMNPKD